MKDYYVILGVWLSATAEEIRAAYRRKAKQLHPDKQNPCMCGTTGPCVHKRETAMQDLNEAYAVLSDPAKRAEYDAILNQQRKVREFVPPVGSGGPVDLMALLRNLAAGRVPDQFVEQLSPVVERKLDEHGINARAATAESILEACGFLKRKKGRKRA